MEQRSLEKNGFFLKGGEDAVLLIHGITGTPSEMRYLGKALHKAGFTVYCNVLPRHCSTLGELRKVTWQEIADACAADFAFLKQGYRRVFTAGLSMGALMAVHVAYRFPSDVAGIAALAPTLFYDGWALHKGKHLMELLWWVPYFRNTMNIREGWPYGLKDETLRENIHRFYKDAQAEAFDDKVMLFGSPFFPLACLYQHQRFVRVAKQELPAVKNPVLIIHAREDDMVSLRNARYLFQHIGSTKKDLVILEDSYHMIPIDREKDRVASEIVRFFHAV